jgi:hypothetical protein
VKTEAETKITKWSETKTLKSKWNINLIYKTENQNRLEIQLIKLRKNKMFKSNMERKQHL